MNRSGLAWLLATALLSLTSLSGCWDDTGTPQYSQLRCDANGCLICERDNCTQYACSTLYECPAGYACTANAQCLPDTAEVPSATAPVAGSGAQCTGSMQCPTGTVCAYGDCVDASGNARATECTLSNQCAANEACIDGACVVSSVGDGEPPITDAQSDCSVAADCAAGEVCQSGSCTAKSFPLRPEGACQFNGDCGMAGTCINTRCYFPPVEGECPAGAAPEFDLCRPLVSPADECQFSSDCGAGALCVNATCVNTCNSDVDCTWGTYCGTTSTCVLDDRPILQCLDNSDCSESCVDGRCLDTCASAGTCSDGFVCTYGYCMQSASCSVSAECASEFDCINGRCDTLSASVDASPAMSDDAEATDLEPSP